MPPKGQSLMVKDVQDGIKICNKSIGNKTQAGLAGLWRDGLLCDLVLKTVDREIEAHRSVLAVHSDYFRAMFTAGLSESSQSCPIVSLDNLDSGALYAVIEYMYTGAIAVNTDIVQDILVVADLLQMLELKNACSEYMERHLDVSNCLGVLEFAEKYGCQKLLVSCVTLVKQRYPVICKAEEFLDISQGRLNQIFSYEDLYLDCDGESTVLLSLLRWLEHDPMSRLPTIPDLLRRVRLKCIPKDVVDKFSSSAIIQGSPEIRMTIEEHLLSEGPDQPRQPIRYMLAIGGFLQSRTGPLCPRLNTVEKYSFTDDTWEKVADLPIHASGVQVFNFHGKILCTAFEMISNNDEADRDIQLQGFYEYDGVQDQWKDATSFFSKEALNCFHDCLVKSGAVAVCSKTQNVYIVTETGVKCISVELDDGDTIFNKVEMLPSIDSFEVDNHANHSAVVVDGDLYVIGGDERLSQTEIWSSASVYMYNRDQNTWVQKASMNEPRARFDVVELDGRIYAIGGFNCRRLRSVERYDPRTDRWTYVSNMNKERSHLKAIVYDGKIYALGGKSYSFQMGGARKVLGSVEYYDPRTDSWHFIQPMKQRRCMFGAVLL